VTEQPTPEHILQVGLGFWASKTLLSAVEMGLFTELAAHPGELGEVGGRLGLHPRSAADFLDALVALGFLDRRDGVYHNTPATELFLDRRKPSYVGGILEMANSRLYGFWGGLTEGLRTGSLQNEAKSGGVPLFEALYADPGRLREFLAAMTGLSHPANVMIAQRFPWDGYASFVDVGTAQGDLAVQIALANPHLAGQGFDLPEVAPIFEDYVDRNGLGGRLSFAAGDFLAGPLPAADVITMGHILHDWDLDQKRMLIGKAYEALPEGGSLIVYEAIIDDERRENAFGLLMSLNMLIETEGGFDYTAADCRGWMAEAGFRESRAEHLVGPDSMVVGVK
jgi:O-methyltransferase domain/Dimerisation domain